MKKYIVVKEWLGSKPLGAIVEFDKIHPSLIANLKEVVKEEELNDADSKKEITVLKTKVTKAENALAAKETELAEALARIEALEAELKAKDEQKEEV